MYTHNLKGFVSFDSLKGYEKKSSTYVEDHYSNNILL